MLTIKVLLQTIAGIVSTIGFLAWLYAVADDDAYRSGASAIEYGALAVEIVRLPDYLDIRACSYAEAGGFDKAIELEEETYSLQPSDAIKKTLECFREGKTWRDMNAGY